MEPRLSHSHPDSSPQIIPRPEHCVSRRNIDDDALQVLQRLRSAGFQSYLVGGGVRDLLLGKTPKDFDIATDARPREIRRLFSNSRVVGRRFRIAHVFFGDKIVEVATFRRGTQEAITTAKGRTILRDNAFGTAEEDARRRDLTINALFYDISTFAIIDYVGGMEDLRRGVVRTINDPGESFREDPVRMIRAQRHAARTGFTIDSATWAAILDSRHLLPQANPSRLLEETLKDLKSGYAAVFFRQALASRLLEWWLPPLASQLRESGDQHPLWGRLDALDRQLRAGATYTVPVLLSVLLQTVAMPGREHWAGEANNPPDAWTAMNAELQEFTDIVRISRRDTERMLEIITAFRKLIVSRERGQLFRSIAHKEYLSEALDFFEIDLRCHGCDCSLVADWREKAPPAPKPARAGFDRGHPKAAKGTKKTEPSRTSLRRRRRRRRRKKTEE